MKRVMLLIPEGLTFEDLPEAQQEAIKSVFGQYAMPMPGTIAYNGLQICDAVTVDSFDPDLMQNFGIDWPIIGMWQWDMHSEALEELQALDEELFLNYLPNKAEYNEAGEVIATYPPEFHIPHNFAGWPEI